MKRLLFLMTLLVCPVALHGSNCFWVNPPTDMAISISYSVFSTSAYSVAQNFSFQCTPNTTSTMKLTRGTNSASFSPRTMKITNPPTGYVGTLMNYQLYTPTAQIWGDGTGGSVSVTFQSFPQDKIYDQNDGAVINATVAGGLDVPPGTYDDTITGTLAWGSGGASSVTQSFRVTVTVIPECTVSTFSLGFGTYDPIVTNLAAPALANNPVVVNCTKSTAATIQLDPGQWSSGGSRRMQNALGAFLPYDIYKDSGYATIWNTANTNGATSGSKSTPLGGPGGYTAWGRILPNLDVSTGSYKDTVQAVVNFLP